MGTYCSWSQRFRWQTVMPGTQGNEQAGTGNNLNTLCDGVRYGTLMGCSYPCDLPHLFRRLSGYPVWRTTVHRPRLRLLPPSRQQKPPRLPEQSSDMALQPSDLPSDYILQDRSVMAVPEVSQLARELGWRQGYYRLVLPQEQQYQRYHADTAVCQYLFHPRI